MNSTSWESFPAILIQVTNVQGNKLIESMIVQGAIIGGMIVEKLCQQELLAAPLSEHAHELTKGRIVFRMFFGRFQTTPGCIRARSDDYIGEMFIH